MSFVTAIRKKVSDYRNFILFAAVGGFGTVLNTAILYLLSQRFGMNYLVASIIATETAIISNFLGNNYITFRGINKDDGLAKRFGSFQLISMVSLVGTLFLLWLFVTLFGKNLLLVWNMLAIIIMFVANFALNSVFTWKAKSPLTSGRKIPDTKHYAGAILIILIMGLCLQTASAANASGDIVSVSQSGYHPLSVKEVVVYTPSTTGSFNIRDASSNAVLANLPLQRPKNYAGADVNCQGNMPCLTGDFTNFSTPGTYIIEENGVNSHSFIINQNVFSSAIPTYLEFFNAQLQQGSSYHADFHSGQNPPFTSMADGSFIMEADQAALPLIRLGSAYRRNPQLFQTDTYNILAAGKPDMQEYIVSYVNYLEGLQGVTVQVGNAPGAVRIGSGMVINSVFIPGPTNITSMNVYIPGNTPTLLQSAPVTSLCGPDDGSAKWKQCIADAAKYYKCQADEPCLNLTYNDKVGTVSSDVGANGFAVSRGWGYEFGCYPDVNINAGGFASGSHDSCQIFYGDSSRSYTAMTLLAYLEAWPAVNDFSASNGQELLARSISTYNYIKSTYPAFAFGDADSGFFGASAFLLYDYTGDVAYLKDAFNARRSVKTTFVSDTTHGNEFYWEEYVRHEQVMDTTGVTTPFTSLKPGPEEYFRGKIFFDYKDAGPTSISNNGERVFQFDPNIQFQNSRYIIIEGLLAQKTTELAPAPETFIPVVAQNQLSWLTGMNLVQQGAGLNAPVKPMSFIFGIGDYPTQFHSRWLVDTGYTSASSGSVVGARGTGYQFLDTSNNTYVYFDGVSNILGSSFGAIGNGWHNESVNGLFNVGRAFMNGKTYIPGWINGAYPAQDGDTIYNYVDNLQSYEYTETTNEIVAAAIEYNAYLDGDMNNRPRYVVPGTVPPPNTTNVTQTGNLTLHSVPDTVSVSLTPSIGGAPVTMVTDAGGNAIFLDLAVGTYAISASKANYAAFASTTTISNAMNLLNISLVPITQSGNLTVTTVPGAVNVTITPSAGAAISSISDAGGIALFQNLAIGSYTVTGTKLNYVPYITTVSVGAGANAVNIPLTLSTSSNNTTGRIVSKTTNLAPISVVNGISLYDMREDANATFSVNFDMPLAVSWYIDGSLQNAATAQKSTFSWVPGILWLPKAPDFNSSAISTVSAISSAGNATWQVQVNDVINPFFSGKNSTADVVGSTDTEVHVFSQNRYLTFTGVNVTIQNAGVDTVYALSKTSSNSIQTDWSVYIPEVATGNSYLAQITGYNNNLGTTTTYILGTDRAHYRTVPTVPSGGGGGGGGSGGRGGGDVPPRSNLILVYALFGKDVVAVNQVQTITLDAKNFNGGVYKVEARVLNPKGAMQAYDLKMVSGTNEYGTWTVAFNPQLPGKYTLYSIRLGDSSSNPLKEFKVENKTFYTVDLVSNAGEELGLVYSVLDQSVVKAGTTVTLTLDAKDASGLQEITAEINSTKGDKISIPLSLVGGSKTYGTWKGTFVAAKPDSTYSVNSITLKNANKQKVLAIEDRSVYVLPVSEAPQNGSGKTGSNQVTGFASLFPLSKEYTAEALKNPFAPVIAGFILMVVVISGIFLVRRR